MTETKQIFRVEEYWIIYVANPLSRRWSITPHWMSVGWAVHPAKIYCVKVLGSDFPAEKADTQYCSQVIKSASAGMVVLTVYTLIRCDGNTIIGIVYKSKAMLKEKA